jgi:hypothetical protein
LAESPIIDCDTILIGLSKLKRGSMWMNLLIQANDWQRGAIKKAQVITLCQGIFYICGIKN